MNPFITAGYVSPEYFCNRKDETNRLLSNIHNNMNVTMYSYRKLGKTALLNHILFCLKKDKKTKGIFIDLYPTVDLNGLVKEFANAILLDLYSKQDKALIRIKNFFKSIIPAVKFDKLTGDPQIEFSFRSVSETESTLRSLFTFLKEQSRKEKIVLVLDEFQQITKYPEKNIEAILRTEIQRIPNVIFIFSGSNKGILESMFNSYNRPFYMSTEMFELKRIEIKEYIDFIVKHFSRNKMKIDTESAEYIYKWTDGITFNIQHICNKIFGYKADLIDLKLVKNVISNILLEKENTFLEYRNYITIQQWNLLKAIAKESKVNMPTSKEFISRYSLGTPSTVKSSLNSLLKKDLVYLEKEYYRVTEIYFSRWMERL